MKRIVYHIMIPAITPAAFFVIASMPVEVLGCRTRGLIALLIAFIPCSAHLLQTLKSKRLAKSRFFAFG
jgi:hypothetical protein